MASSKQVFEIQSDTGGQLEIALWQPKPEAKTGNTYTF